MFPVVALIITLLSAFQCAQEAPERRAGTHRAIYEVSYADGTPGNARIKYFNPAMERTLEDNVSTPWRTELNEVRLGVNLRLEAVAAPSDRVLQCVIVTDEGTLGREFAATAIGDEPCIVVRRIGDPFGSPPVEPS
jgi:hypothetical protein